MLQSCFQHVNVRSQALPEHVSDSRQHQGAEKGSAHLGKEVEVGDS